jgi:hypothetical protein
MPAVTTDVYELFGFVGGQGTTLAGPVPLTAAENNNLGTVIGEYTIAAGPVTFDGTVHNGTSGVLTAEIIEEAAAAAIRQSGYVGYDWASEWWGAQSRQQIREILGPRTWYTGPEMIDNSSNENPVEWMSSIVKGFNG